MGDEQRDDAADRRIRADVYASARIRAAAALTIVLAVLLANWWPCVGGRTTDMSDASHERCERNY